MDSSVFIPARDPQFYLLKAQRQPLPANLVRHYIENLTAPGDLVIDAFAASDVVARIAVEMRRRAVLVDSNPLVAFAAQGQASLPSARDVNAAFARLGEIPKEDEPLKAHLEKLYASSCAHCGATVSVEYFIHRRDAEHTLLAEKVYECRSCGQRRDDATEEDRQRAAEITPRGLSYHLLLQRVLADDPHHPALIKRLLQLYTSRNLYALATLTQKLDAEFRDDPARRLLDLFLLHALDVGTSLYPVPDALPRREIPEEFIEVNLWRAVEMAARGLSERAPGMRLARRALDVVTSPTPTAFIGHGGARVLADTFASANVTASAALLISSPARLDPALWELSFLWTRWLLGKNAAAPLEPLLDEKRQRWGWYGSALTNALADAAALLRADARMVLAFPSGSHAMIEALTLAAAPQFALETLAFRPHRGALNATEFGALRGDYRAIWQRAQVNAPVQAGQQVAPKIRTEALRGAMEILNARGEPLSYSWLHHSALQQLARAGGLAELMQAKLRAVDNPFQFLRHRLEEGIKEGYAEDLDHWQDKTRVLWMRRTMDDRRQTTDDGRPTADDRRQTTDDQGRTLAERVEMFVRGELQEKQRVKIQDLEDAVLRQFSGLLTPEIELVEMCAWASADLIEGEWVWRAGDASAELSHARTLVAQLGARLGFEVQEDADPFQMLWRVEKIVPGSSTGALRETRVMEDAYVFIWRARADFRDLVTLRAAPLRGFVVIPEAQVALTQEHLRRDPRWLKRLARAGWEFLRVPFVAQLLRKELTERPEFPLAWGLDPPLARGKEQMELF